jgi:hypothetical protein
MNWPDFPARLGGAVALGHGPARPITGYPDRGRPAFGLHDRRGGRYLFSFS